MTQNQLRSFIRIHHITKYCPSGMRADVPVKLNGMSSLKGLARDSSSKGLAMSNLYGGIKLLQQIIYFKK